ncbi:peptide transporter [Sulfurimonas sp. SWIR-19]|uniref:STT3 domain-containing protein n=1 Tax=Sulfurimonas sp. SWIR-19 TaxID=2878390 RepID=UPI001CF47212|nr:STT3 domain-containing protein [Sulfurimonas sp. SWIR-19]UCN01159.1 peptide transporter [Sulfurimonas sp. SWIR-19]
MTDTSHETKLTLLYIFIAFAFSIGMRLIWVYHFNGYAPFYFNNQFMINTNDGYVWAEGARDLLSGTVTNPDAKEYFDKFHQLHDLSPVSSAASQLTAFFAKILPFSFESVIFYLPVFLSSLVVIPIVLIAKALKNLEMGLIAALLASIAWSYYNRTMAGYYDTDMLNIVLPMFLLWSVIWAIQTKKDIYLLFTALDILVYRWWYPQSYSLEFSFFGLILFYTLVFDRKNVFNYKLLAIMMFAMMNTDGLIRLGAVLAAFYIFKQEKLDKYIYYILGLSIIAFFVTGGFSPIWSQLKGYIFRESVSTGAKGLGLHFFTVMQTVREAGHIPFETFANRISGNTVTFVIALFGYMYLLYKHRIMLFSLPLVGLGFLAYVGGLRFTIYAVPILAFGIAFLITQIAEKMPTQKLKVLSMSAFTLLTLYPNYKHIEAYKVPTVFNANEVKVLTALGKKADREDYVVAWWDYGYPIRYYADVKTLADGGKHSGSVNFPVSFMLTHTQEEAAKMARLDVEYTEKTYEYTAKNKKLIEDKNLTVFSNIEQMTKDYGYKDTNKFLKSLQSDIKLPQKTRDIYFYLPFRMINIYPTVTLFSNLNLMNGAKRKQPFFFISRNFKDTGAKIQLAQNIFLDKRTSMLTIGKQTLPIRRFVVTKYDKNMHLHKDVKLINLSSNISVMYMADYRTFLIVDEKTYNSLYIQLMVLENYNKKLFEPVILTPQAKVYKLKI